VSASDPVPRTEETINSYKILDVKSQGMKCHGAFKTI